MLSTLIKFTSLAEKIVPRKSSIPVLHNVCIKDGKIIATDLEMTASMPIEHVGSMLIPFRILKTVLKSKPKTVAIATIKDGRIKIDYDNKAVIFPSMDVEDFPTVPVGSFEVIGTYDKSIIKQLYELVPFCSSDLLRPSLCGIYIIQNGSLKSVATDGHVLRLIHDDDYKSTTDFKGIIPKRVIQLLPRFVKKEVTMSASADHLCFSIEGKVNILVNKVDNVFPNYERVIPKEFSGHVEVDPGALSCIVKSAMDFANRDQRKSIIELKGDVLSMLVENDDLDSTWQSGIKLGGPANQPMKLALDLVYLDKVLAGKGTDKLLWKYNDNTSASIFMGDGPDMTLIMPIRLTREDEDE